MKKRARDYITATDIATPKSFVQTVRFTLNRYGFLGGLARYLMLQDELRKFINAARSEKERLFRRELLKKFDLIQRNVICAHSPYQFVLMADFILNLKIPGPIVQCGSFKGGSTAKLSLLAKRARRRLYVCDSFEGLPRPESRDEANLLGFGSHPNYIFAAGEYKGTLDEVKENVKKYGHLEVCEFVSGFFSQSLKNLNIKPAFIFIDVDLVSSARDCLKYLWPRLAPGGYWFTHEAVFPEYIRGILDAQWWQKNLRESPPVVLGAGSGLSPIAQNLAYFQKRAKK